MKNYSYTELNCRKKKGRSILGKTGLCHRARAENLFQGQIFAKHLFYEKVSIDIIDSYTLGHTERLVYKLEIYPKYLAS